MAEIVEQVQEREAAHVSHQRTEREKMGGQCTPTGSCHVLSLWLFVSDKRRNVSTLQQPLSTGDSFRWATPCKRPPKAQEEAPPKGA